MLLFFRALRHFSKNCTMADSDIVNEWLKSKHIECRNVRTFKSFDSNNVPVYDICLASVDRGACSGITVEEEEFKGCKFKVHKKEVEKKSNMYIVCIQESFHTSRNLMKTHLFKKKV